jgi:hypothetical protein
VSDIQIGTRIRDNDPRRTADRVLTIIEIADDRQRVVAQKGRRTTSISMDSIYTDGKPRRTGFSVIHNEGATDG